MKILVLGSTGMLGHQLVKSLSVNHEVDTMQYHIHGPGALELNQHLDRRPAEVVVNCIGIVKQREGVCTAAMIEVNSVLPHDMAYAVRVRGARFIHFSTDCVFSGDTFGSYSENDEPDPQDLYGRSKLLGEVYDQGCITLRTSLIGRELNGRKQGLVEWFLSQTGEVPGYAHSFFSGVTTIEAARIVELVLRSPDAHGVWHVGGPTIRKQYLLELLQKHYNHPVNIVRTALPVCDRSLDSTRFQRYFGYAPPSWDDMIKEMANAER